MKPYNLLLLSIHQPLYYALYLDNDLVYAQTIDEKPSSALPRMYNTLKERKETINNIYYANGPGNLSALKLTHTFLHTWAIAENVKLYAAESFALLPDSFIYAFGKKYFTKSSSTTTQETLRQEIYALLCAQESSLKQNLKDTKSLIPHSLQTNASNNNLSTLQAQLLAEVASSITCVLLTKPPPHLCFEPPQVLPKAYFCLPCEPLYILPPL